GNACCTRTPARKPSKLSVEIAANRNAPVEFSVFPTSEPLPVTYYQKYRFTEFILPHLHRSAVMLVFYRGISGWSLFERPPLVEPMAYVGGFHPV
ncbi:MAG: hypothetical protein DMG90_01740, partial [Acidobacteria bacterium]